MSAYPFFSYEKVDVFLSSCCEKRLEYLTNLFYENGISAFTSTGFLERSVKPIRKRTLNYLEDAKVAVVMMFEEKPYTVGFLEELRLILEVQAKGSLKVIPIFRTPNCLHDVKEEICRQYPENMLIWKTALTKLANIAAEYPFSQRFAGMDQSDWLKQIADDISLLLVYSTINDSNVLVAMDRHMKVVYDLLASEINKKARTIGIWGSVGVGKTTLARYIYAEIFVKFQTHVFLENFENMKDKILEFESAEDPSVIRSLDRDVHDITEARRKHHKVLLIADEVSNIEQWKWIIEYTKWFAPGSNIILISRNQNLLVDAGVKHVYEVRLRYDEALQLFSHFAFKQSYPPFEFEQLAVRAVQLAGFLPLAIRLLGLFLTGKGQEEWLAALLKLKAKRGGNIMEVWKLMDPLGDKGQEEWEAAEEIMEAKKSAAHEKQY